MPTWGATKAGAAAATTSSGLGAGNGPHIPVGTWSGTKYRSAIRFQDPPWAAWTSITKATLKVKTTDFAHVGPRNSTIFAKRTTVANLWLIGSGAQDCNNGFSGSNTTQYSDLNPTSTDAVSFQSGTAENSWKSIDVTAAVRYYFANKVSSLTFILDGQDSSDYAEFWSDDKSGGEPTLTIDYVDASPPAAPTLVAPAANAVNQSLTPTLSWTHDGSDGAQTGADIDMWETSAPTHLSLIHVTGAAGSTVIPAGKLQPGLQYQWQVRTSNSTGTGPYSGIRYFTTDPDLGVVITGSEITWANGKPRILLDWAATSQYQYQIEKQDGTILVPWVTSPNTYHVLDQLDIADNVSVALRVRARTTYLVADFADATIKPRFGLSSHHKVISAPSDWLSATPTLVAPVPTGATIHMQYGSHPSSATAPLSWVDDIGQVPKGNTHFFWRVYLMPGQGGGPTLDKLVISTLGGAALDLDKWTTNATFPTTQRPVKPHAFAAPWAVDQSEYVYGSRSVSVDVAGPAVVQLWHEASIRLRAKRSYILTGLMKSSGNSGAHFELQDATGTVITAQGVGLPGGPMRSPILTGDTTFYSDLKDVHRYRTPVLTVGDTDIDVYVVLKAGGDAGSKAYFDAIKLEESTVATPWSPGSVGASIVDAGGVQIDGQKGGVFRYKGSAGGLRDTVEGSAKGLLFAGDTELASDADGSLTIDGLSIRKGPRVPPVTRLYTATGTVAWAKPANLSHITVEVMGGGGAGGGAPGAGSGNAAGSGGGAGAYARHLYTAEELTLASYNVTVGIAGAGGNGAGGAGGNSAFVGPGTQLMGTGGSGGIVGTNSTGNITTGGAPGGVASGPPGAFLADGASGMRGTVRGGAYVPTGNGASSFIGGGGNAGAGGGGEVGQAKGSGGGGAAANTVTFAGGAGAAGLVIVTEYYL